MSISPEQIFIIYTNLIYMSKKGKFIVFEGGEGSGKDTQIEFVQKDFPDFIYTREPGGTNIGEEIRSLLLSKDSNNMSVKVELLLFLAARAQLLEEVIIPALNEGKTVVSNRFGLSTIAYQIYGREHPEYLDFLEEISNFVVDEYSPDLYILLDVDPEVGLKRVSNRSDENTRFDDEKLDFHKRTREGYIKHVGDLGENVVINANQSVDAIRQRVHEVLKSI